MSEFVWNISYGAERADNQHLYYMRTRRVEQSELPRCATEQGGSLARRPNRVALLSTSDSTVRSEAAAEALSDRCRSGAAPTHT